MKIKDKALGECEVTINHGVSVVDSFLESGYSDTLGRELTNDELERLQDEYASEIQAESWEGGYSVNHN